MQEPTQRQKQVLVLVRDYIAQHGYPPTKRELADILGVSSATGVSDILDAAERKGLVVLVPFISRGIRLTTEGLEAIKESEIGRAHV